MVTSLNRSEIAQYDHYILEDVLDLEHCICFGITDDVDGNQKVIGVGAFEEAGSIEGENKKNIRLVSIYIDPAYRRRGLFKNFIRENARWFKVNGYGGILVQFVFPEAEHLDEALTALGFERLLDGNTIYTFDIELAAHSPLLKRNTRIEEDEIIPFDKLDPEILHKFYEDQENIFPAGLTTKELPGEWLRPLSYAYISGGRVVSYLLSSNLGGDTLYIGALFVDERYKMIGIAPALARRLLLDMPSYPAFKKAMLAAASEAGAKFVRKCVDMHPDKDKVIKQEIRRYYLEV